MKKIRGFKLVKVFKWIIRPGSRSSSDGFSGQPSPIRCYNPFSKTRSFFRFLRCRTRWLCDSNSGSDYIRLGEEGTKRGVGVPKGHLAVYVGESEGDTRRVVVPVIYFNHPLFGELLKDSERVYGFNQKGGITLPCGISEFEKVKMRIADWDHCRREKRRRY
ncbi:SMALL AUXIN UPREGULATED RNA 35 [Hibiscus trionum]|uniref:SMALL AUXIN UPREGULATED RNA 35 n=1 Tax=Hibiscus trionum TaxID=183268 RepID=A0A9W7MDF5_HIBTR|nr:SMALL AUXIN UPREGULATED RNA 35 [Hibiscus trionum]